MTELLCVGISHKTAAVGLRERLSLLIGETEDFCRQLLELPTVCEAVAISTCNRTEIYLVGEADSVLPALRQRLIERARLDRDQFDTATFAPRNCEAARHLFRVSSGLDSMIIGEAEIQGQVKRAYEVALAAETVGPLTSRLFSAALRTGKRVRSETLIGAGHASVSSVAVALAEEVVGHLDRRRVLIVGAGKTSDLTARALAERGVKATFVVNRDAGRGRSLADRFGAETASLRQLPQLLADTDIVVTSTSAPHVILTADELKSVLAARAGRPLVLIDIAVPRDIDPGCGALDGVELYDIDDLERTVVSNLSIRAEERHRAEQVVEDEILRFADWLGQREVLPTIADLRRRGDEIARHVVAENSGRWESASARDLERIEALAQSIVSRLLHTPTMRLKESQPTGSPLHGRVQAVRDLFGLDEQGPVVSMHCRSELRRNG